jgi:hypothetical protein
LPIDKPCHSFYTAAGIVISIEVRKSQLNNYLKQKKQVAAEEFPGISIHFRILAQPVHAISGLAG